MVENHDKKLHYHIKKNADLSKLPKIEGYNFNEKFDFNEFIKAFSTSGIQAANLGTAIEITKTMVREKTPIFLSFKSFLPLKGSIISPVIASLAIALIVKSLL